MGAMGLGLGLAFGHNGGGIATINAPFASVNSNLTGPTAGPYEGWSVQYGSQPTISANVPFTVSRQGFTGSTSSSADTSATSTYLDTMYVVDTTSAGGAVRQPYPNQASQSALTAALSDYIYSTDTPSGSATNGSTFTSPKPVANWAMPHRSTVGNSLTVECVSFHRNARNKQQVACVVFRATDGTNTVYATAAAAAVSNATLDRNAVLTHKATLDITSLTAGLITVNAKVYPWIGAGAASVLDSADQTLLKDFSPRYFLKNTSLASTPYRIYVDAAGNNLTCAVSTNDATAAASPAATIRGAYDKIQSSALDVDAVEIRVRAGTFTFQGPTVGQMNQKVGALIITRDPSVARNLVTVNFGSDEAARLTLGFTSPVATGCIRFTDIQLTRAANLTLQGGFGGSGARLEIQWVDVDMNGGGFAGTWLNLSDDAFYGATLTNMGSGMFSGSAAGQHRCFRGVSGTVTGNIETILHLGCDWTASGGTLVVTSGGTQDGTVVAFNRFRTITNTSFWTVSTVITNGMAIAQNVFEYSSVTSGLAVGVGNDSLTNNTSQVIIHNNTMVGFFTNGRVNLFYDDGASARTHKLQSVIGNILVQINTKSDVFQTDGTRIGNWGFMYGVGCAYNWTNYIDANNGGLGGSFAQAYGGIGSSIGTSNTTPQMANARFTSYAATSSGPTGGAGGGTYTVTSSAEVKSLLLAPVFPFDLAGTARPSSADTIGAYVAP